MNKSYRIKTNVGVDSVLNVNLKQDIDIYEILSLNLKQENLYKLHSADYGVIVGRVLANDAFGVPNVKVSVFIPLSDVDKLRQDIRSIYPYNFVTDRNSKNVKFNILPNYKKFDCHQEVGSFPKKQLVLDSDTILEIYDKYYKYTTITNKAGDYMIFGVPTGEQILHVDVDLSDIGIISQEPRDFIYKGYSIDLFESPTQFKKSTNLDDLPQIQTQNTSITVYPLWGDKNTGEIAITRKDVNLQYKFETTCVFLGSVITDGGSNSISHNCIPDANVGEAYQLSPSKGNIEMIRKTVDDRIEEFPIKGNQLIDSDGTWCYQIPMNLDYVGMDEYGNIVPTNNPLKGIPTRARVRFRITLDESGDDDLTRHKARYLVPNNPDLYEGKVEPYISDYIVDTDSYYEFGTLTPDDCFRDLYWNKVYSVKNYIPRIQMSKHEKTPNYVAIKGINKKGAAKNNPIPYNKLNLNFSIPAYYLLYNYGIGNVGVSGFWRYLKTYSIPYNTDNVRESIIEELDAIGLDFYNDWLNGCLYFPSWFWHIRQKKNHRKGESTYESVFCECKNKADDNITSDLYIYNNCSLAYENDDLTIKTLRDNKKDYLYDLFYEMYTSIPFGSKQFFSGVIKRKANKDGADAFYYSFGNKLKNEKVKGNTDFDNTFPEEIRPKDEKSYYKYARLYSTDIILLGSLKECDLDGVPKVSYNIPSTTSNIPPMGRFKETTEEIDGDAASQRPSYDLDDSEVNIVSYNGMNWGAHWHAEGGFFSSIVNAINDAISMILGTRREYKYRLGSGLFFGLSSAKIYKGSDWVTAGLIVSLGAFGAALAWLLDTSEDVIRRDIVPRTDLKTCVNAERISELGVTLDSEVNLEYDNIDGSTGYSYISEMDGLITKREIEDVDSRALFATLNHNKLIGTTENYRTGYKKYNLEYFYPTNFDGRMGDKIAYRDKDELKEIDSISEFYTSGITRDDRNKDYLDFRFGNKNYNYNTSYRSLSVDFDGKQKYVETENITGEIAKNVNNGNYNEYLMGDGYVKLTRYMKPRNRHFYGYKNGIDTAYPFARNYDKFDSYPYAFPLYNNSFYFYFGLNPGSSAIDKFYEQFYSECPTINTSSFIVETSVTAATACGNSKGTIRVNVQEITLPYNLELWDDDILKEEKNNVNTYISEFTNLNNGNYKIVIKDLYGNTMSENVTLKYQKISLKTTVLRGILTEYIGQGCKDICTNDYYGKLSIDSYTNYGQTRNVTLTKLDNGIYKIGNGSNGDIRIDIIPNDGGFFYDYICTCTKEQEDNVINFSKPGTFTIKVYEMCGDIISDNVSYYTVTISDSKRLEMYINDIPLKYIVGSNEDLVPYNKWFHNYGEQVNIVKDDSIKGWFGVHNPDAYSDLFTTPLNDSNDKAKLYKSQWTSDIGYSGNLDIIREKLNFMFNLSKNTYVTAGSKNSFTVRLDGADGELLLRSASPEYDKFSEYNTDTNFNSYLTNEEDSVICNEFNANIVSENYRYVSEDDHFPEECGVSDYDFNPKYSDKVNCAANYFAGFSNNANIIQTDSNKCERGKNYKPYQVIPYKANDLFDDYHMCLDGEKKGILPKVYSQYRYFRTEFIDRRFDYNMFFITGHRGIHYDINDYEKEILDSSETKWDKGRISAVTYNGIDMLYNIDKGDKLIVSDTDDTEYKYTVDTAQVKLNLEQPKRFYDSRLYYGNGKYVDLLNAFYYSKNTGATAFYSDENDVLIELEHIKCCKSDEYSSANFGFNGYSVEGYPAKRSLNYLIPYGDNYNFYNVCCGYDGLTISQTTAQVKAVAVPGEVIDFNIEAGELINLECNDFVIDCKQGHYNVKYTGAMSGTLVPSKISDISFRIDSVGSQGFRTKIGDLGIRLCWDNADHKKLESIKNANCVENAIAILDETKKWQKNYPDAFDTSESFKNTLFSATNIDWSGEYEFINMFFDRIYYSHMADSLRKDIRVFNLSTIYNVSKFSFSYDEHGTVSDEFKIPKGSIEVEVRSGSEPEPEDNDTNLSRENEGVGDEPSEGESILVGSNVNDVKFDKNYDYTIFTFTSKFLANCLDDICFMIDYADDTAYYTLEDNNVEIISKDLSNGTITFSVVWTKHKTLLKPEEDEEDNNEGEEEKVANIVVYMKIKNEIKSKYGEGHMEFAFGFQIKGEDTVIVGECNPEDYVGGKHEEPNE